MVTRCLRAVPLRVCVRKDGLGAARCGHKARAQRRNDTLLQELLRLCVVRCVLLRDCRMESGSILGRTSATRSSSLVVEIAAMVDVVGVCGSMRRLRHERQQVYVGDVRTV